MVWMHRRACAPHMGVRTHLHAASTNPKSLPCRLGVNCTANGTRWHSGSTDALYCFPACAFPLCMIAHRS